MTAATLPTERPIGPRFFERRDRWIAIALALALHLAILALFLGSRPPAALGQGTGNGAMDVSLAGLSRGASPSPARFAAAAPARPAPSPPAPPVVADPIKPRSVIAIVSDILNIPLLEHSVTPQPLETPTPTTPTLIQSVEAASGSPGAACDIAGAVQTALRLDPETHGAALLIPMRERGAANAVMVWNGAWIDPAAVGGEAVFTPIRVAIRRIVANAQPDCRDQNVIGPRFMLVPEGDATMVLVFGNASWRWSDLLVDPSGAPSATDAKSASN